MSSTGTVQANGDIAFPTTMRYTPIVTLIYGGIDGRVRSALNGSLYDGTTTEPGLVSVDGFGGIHCSTTWNAIYNERFHFGYTADAELN